MTTYSSTCRDLPGPGDLAGEPPYDDGRDEITNDDILAELIERLDSLRIARKQRDDAIFADCLRGLAEYAEEHANLLRKVTQ